MSATAFHREAGWLVNGTGQRESRRRNVKTQCSNPLLLSFFSPPPLFFIFLFRRIYYRKLTFLSLRVHHPLGPSFSMNTPTDQRLFNNALQSRRERESPALKPREQVSRNQMTVLSTASFHIRHCLPAECLQGFEQTNKVDTTSLTIPHFLFFSAGRESIWHPRN